MSTAYHPQTDGQSERTIQTLEVALRYLISQGKEDWPRFLPLLRLSLNNRRSETTGKSPNEIVYGFNLREGFELCNLNDQQCRQGDVYRSTQHFQELRHLAR